MKLFEGEHDRWESRAFNPVLGDKYIRGLAVYDHLNECLILANEIKRVKNYKSEAEGEENKALEEKLYNLTEHYKNELMDLFILLQSDIEISRFLSRIEKFQEKIKEDMESKTERINETEKVSDTIVVSKTIPVEVEKGDCISCPYKTNTTSGICSTYAIYGWCRQTKGENPPDMQEPKSFYSEAIRWVDSTPNSYYPIRILRAYLDYTETRTNPHGLGDFMNELQNTRNALLEKAIDILSKHLEELSAVIEDPFYRGLPELDMLEQINEIRRSLDKIEESLETSSMTSV